MEVQVQLQISGNDISSYDIYQDSDNFATQLVTATSNDLLTGISLICNDLTKTIRVISNGGCGTQRDIPINFNDTTPSVTVQGDDLVDLDSYYSNMASDGKGNICLVSNGGFKISVNNGSSFSPIPSALFTQGEYRFVIRDNNNFRILSRDGQLVNCSYNGSTWAINGPYSISPITDTIYDFYFYNNFYYIKTNKELFRAPAGENFQSVLVFENTLNAVANNSMDSYGDVMVVSASGDGFYKSTDNGLNWTKIYDGPGGFAGTVYVESETKFMVQLASSIASTDNNWLFTLNGGVNWGSSWLEPVRYAKLSAPTSPYCYSTSIIKVGPNYYYNTSPNNVSGATNLKYTSTDIFSTSFSGTIYEVNNSEMNITAALPPGLGRYNNTDLLYSKGSIVYSRSTPYNSDVSTFCLRADIANT